MDIVVILALGVLAAVFLFSLLTLIVMCHRRYAYNRLLAAQALRFSKLRQEHLEEVVQLGPHLSQRLSSNRWVEEVSGVLQDCLAVLKLCHLLTEKLAHVPLAHISPQMNDLICQATTRVVPRFDALLRAMAAKRVDVRLVEARVASLVIACWALVGPFYLINPKYRDLLGGVVERMEAHHRHLAAALAQAELEDAEEGAEGSEDGPSTSSAAAPDHQQRQQQMSGEQLEMTPLCSAAPAPSGATANGSVRSARNSENAAPSRTPPAEGKVPLTTPLSIRLDCCHAAADEGRDRLLHSGSDEAPADPSSSAPATATSVLEADGDA